MYPGAAIIVTPASWEAERHRRGLIRWYPFDALPTGSSASAGSSSTLDTPGIRFISGVSAGGPDYRVNERAERRLQYWKDQLGRQYWGYAHKLTTFMCPETMTVGPTNGDAYCGCNLHVPGSSAALGMNGTQAANATTFPEAGIYLRRQPNGTLAWILKNSVGDGVTPATITVMTNVVTPVLGGSADSTRYRLEVEYVPNSHVAGWIDGVLGARVTTNLPNPADTGLAGENVAGIGVYSSGDLGNVTVATFMGMMLETFGVL